jgi:ABC-type lipoprotein export system ATPase subunit
MDSPAKVLELVEVSKIYRSVEEGAPIEILKGLNLGVAAGESLAIIGPSGSGKSTLLNIMGTLDRPTAGQVKLDGQDLSGLEELHLAAIRNGKIGFIFQLHHLLPHCTVLENVLVPTLAHPDKAARKEAEARGRQLLERVGLGERLNHLPGQLSGGERQRVAVVRALINQPQLLLADEPTGALDRSSAQELGRLLVELNREQKLTLIVVTHASGLAEQMGRVFELRGGRLVTLSSSP